MAAGVKLVENLASFTDAYGTNKNFKKSAKNIKVNPWADAGSLSRDKYFSGDKTTGSAQWKGLLDDTNPDVRDMNFITLQDHSLVLMRKGLNPLMMLMQSGKVSPLTTLVQVIKVVD